MRLTASPRAVSEVSHEAIFHFPAIWFAHWVGPPFRPKEIRGQDEPQQQIDQLIDELGNKSFKVRDDATRQLKKLDDAIPPLVGVLGSKDAEVARRAQEILTTIRERTTRETKRRLLTDWKNLGVDEIIDQVVHLKLSDEDWWQNAYDLAEFLAEIGLKKKPFPANRKRWLTYPLIVAKALKEAPPKEDEFPLIARRIIAHTCHSVNFMGLGDC